MCPPQCVDLICHILLADCLDNGNNKKAIQEADKVLRKQKDFQCAKVGGSNAAQRGGTQGINRVFENGSFQTHEGEKNDPQLLLYWGGGGGGGGFV